MTNYIVIPRWEEFQHYKNRRPPWLKTYLDQLDNPEYLALTFAQRGLLHDLRLAYARTRRELIGDTAALSRYLGERTTSAQLAALNHAGFIELRASAPRTNCASPELEKEEELPKLRVEAPVENSGNEGGDVVLLRPPSSLAELVSQVELAPVDPDTSSVPRRKPHDPRTSRRDGTSRYTGCRQTRGQGGFGYVQDPLGIDRPPVDWPHEPPSSAEVLEALRAKRGAA